MNEAVERLCPKGVLMKAAIRSAILILLIAVCTLPAAADKAKSLYAQGKDAEARQNYEQAYDYYRQAYDLKPTDLTYRSAATRTRFLAAASLVHRGQQSREAGNLPEALDLFQKAFAIDPASFIAKQEIARTRKMIEAAQPPPTSSAPPPSELQKRIEQASGPVDLTAISNVPITLKLTEDSKMIYETVGKLAGINVLFDPDYTSRRIKVELNGVTLQEALEIIALESKTFWRAVTPNTIFVASDTPAKRKDLEQSVIKTFYLANLSQPTELQDITNAMRQILEIQRIQPLPTEGALVVRGTPDQIALASKLVGDLDKAKPEVIVEVAVMQVSRDKMRQLGINPPTSATVALQNNFNNTTGTTTGGTTTTGVSNTTTGTPNQVSLNRIGNLNATDFTVTIPPASITAMLSDSSVKIVQNPQIRALDGQKATLKIGDRVPVATGSFQPGIGGVGINPLVNTQFQYLDVGVNIDITPKVHAGNEVTLKVVLDVSAVTSTTNIGGISQPVIGQRKIEHDIRLKEGEVNLLGGILEDQQTKSLTGIPGLAQIPVLHYLFGQTNTEHRENEIVFALIPHIVRGPDISELNQRALNVGTASAIQLHRAVPAVTPAAQPATPAPGTPRGNAPGSSPTGAATPAPNSSAPAQQQAAVAQPAASQPPGAGGPATFSFDPSSLHQKAGATFTVNVMISGVQNVSSVPLQVSYDPKVLQMVNVSNGNFLTKDGQAVALVHREDDQSGALQITASRPPGSAGVSGQGSVVTLTFMAKAAGQSALTIAQGGARDGGLTPIPVSGAVANVIVE
jgi:general secretion pathway protein D